MTEQRVVRISGVITERDVAKSSLTPSDSRLHLEDSLRDTGVPTGLTLLGFRRRDILPPREGAPAMSLGIVVKAPEGLVLAAESRVTLTAIAPGQPPIHVNFDNATKLLSFGGHHTFVGAVTYGQAAIGLRTAHSFIPEFEATLPDERIAVEKFAGEMSAFFMDQWRQSGQQIAAGVPDMTFVVAGFDEDEAYGRVYEFGIPRMPDLQPRNTSQDEFGITWGGQREVVDRLLRGYDYRLLDVLRQQLALDPGQVEKLEAALAPLGMQVPLQALPLQDCIDLAIFFIRTTIAAQELTVGVRGCGGSIDVATITRREGLAWIQQKQIHGEFRK